MNRYLIQFVHILGSSCLVVSAAHQLYAFYLIQVKDVAIFLIQEPVLAIRYSEIIMSVFGVAYAVFIFFKVISNQTRRTIK